jgi:hypothetical protein
MHFRLRCYRSPKACTENPFGLVSVHCYIPTGFAVYVFYLKTAVSRVSWTMTENICFPIPQQTGGGRLKTSKTVDSPRLGRLAVLVLSAYVGNLYVSLLRAITSFSVVGTTYIDRDENTKIMGTGCQGQRFRGGTWHRSMGRRGRNARPTHLSQLPYSLGFQAQLLSAPSPGSAGSGCPGNDQAAFKAMAVLQSGLRTKDIY